MSKRVKRKRDARLSVMPNPNYQKQAKKSEMLDNVDTIEEVAHTSGNKGFAQRCKEQGIMLRVCAYIRKFRVENPDTSASDLYKELHRCFPQVFVKDPEEMYGSNFMKVIQAEPDWNSAFFSQHTDLKSLAEYRVFKILEDEKSSEVTVMKAYDKVMRYETLAKQLEMESAGNTGGTRTVNLNIGLGE